MLNLETLSAPDFLQLAGHPLRWRLLGELARSDRMVGELTRLVSQPQNLVSYHLAKLRDARLVFVRRSSADRRDNYYGLDIARLGGLFSSAGGALHPGLRLMPPPADAVPLSGVRVLFLCTGNSARSPMAAALARAISQGGIEAHSAGSAPRSVHPGAVRVMQAQHGLDISAHIPRHLDEFAGERFDCVVSLCDRVREVCPDFPGASGMIHWSIENPVSGDTGETNPDARFEQTAAELANRIEYLLVMLAH
ncbi:MAG: ArsR family transcriptional regulator [Pseudomonadales bacterium]|nr:ArsR family transcriptional regulator [Pseudomonadales bacterium]